MPKLHAVRRVFRNALFHPDPAKRCWIAGGYLGAGLLANFFGFQVFCMPVLWAAVWFSACTVAVLTAPWWLEARFTRGPGMLLLGAAVPAYSYCLIFLADPWNGFREYLGYAVFILFGGLGLLAFLPAYLLYHVVRYYRAVQNWSARTAFWCGVAGPLVVLGASTAAFRESDRALQRALRPGASSQAWDSVPRTYFTERLTGIGFKYHTKLEFIYDGWRPPLHDPLLNSYLWLTADTFYPKWPVRRPAVYQALFPGKSLWVTCPCSYTHDGRTYFLDTSTFASGAPLRSLYGGD